MVAKQKNDNSESRREQPLQAILLTSTFTQTFHPLTLSQSTPRILFPLLNTPILYHTLDLLSASGVEELFIFSVHDKTAIESALAQYSSHSGKMKITVLQEISCTNAGDALRELDRSGLIRSDPFLLLHGGDVISNVNLREAIHCHKLRKKKDSAAIMTMLFKEVGGLSDTGKKSHSALRAVEDDLIVGMDPKSDNRILVFDDHVSNNVEDSAAVPIPCSFFSSHSSITLRRDLLDIRMDICSPEVLARFSDEFDYTNIRKHFIHNSVCEEEEGLQNKIYGHILGEKEYAGRVFDFRTYHQISMDLLRRWCYPLVPDNLAPMRYVANRHFVYRCRAAGNTRIERSVQIMAGVMIGKDCQIGEDCVLNNTVIGHEVVLGRNCTVTHSHIWDGVVVHEDCKVDHSVLCNGCVIKKGARIGRGCVIGPKCVIGENVILPDFTRITLEEDREWGQDGEGWDDDSEDDSSDENSDDDADAAIKENTDIISDHDIVGDDGLGRVWTPSADDIDDDDSDMDDETDFQSLAIQKMQSESIGFDPSPIYQKRITDLLTQPINDDFNDGDDSAMNNEPDHIQYDSLTETTLHPTASASSLPDISNSSAALDQDGFLIQGRQKGVDVIQELKNICLEHESSSPIENLIIELNGFKFSQNATFEDVVSAAILAILERLEITAVSTTPMILLHKFKGELKHWIPLFTKMCHGLKEEKSIIYMLEMVAAKRSQLVLSESMMILAGILNTAPSFRFVVQTLFDEEILSEEAILAWKVEREEGSGDDFSLDLFLQKETQAFLEWLEEESEDGSGSDDESDED